MHRSIRIGSLVLAGWLAPWHGAAAQGLGGGRHVRGPAADAGRPPLVVTGRVVMQDGSPAAGAVVTSAGGQAFTGQDGEFTLEVDAPLDAESLDVTAVRDEQEGDGSLVAHARIVPAALTATSSVGSLVLSQSLACHPRWLRTFGHAPGADAMVQAFTVFDDGSGPVLFVGGVFSVAGSVPANRVARWDGTSWSPLGSGMNAWVYALTTYDDGTGPALFAGGVFTSAGGTPANHIAKWDGSSWSPVGSGMNDYGHVHALTVYDDGTGPALYAGGGFTTAGGVSANRIAKWDGSSWSELGSGVGAGGVNALAVYDDGTGPALYAGGTFTTAGGMSANRIAKWDGSSWSALGSGTSDSGRALAVYDDGGGPRLYAGGLFTTAGGITVNRVARWDGSSWSALGSGVHSGGRAADVAALTVYDDGAGSRLYAGGLFTTAGGITVNRVARWDGSSWSALGSGIGAVSFIHASEIFPQVEALAVYDDGSGPALFAGGSFVAAGNAAANNMAKWDGSSWTAPATSARSKSVNEGVSDLAVHDDGSGPALYAGGGFSTAGGVVVRGIARWDGASWSALGSGMSQGVSDLTVFDDGGGPALFAGGSFTSAGGTLANHIAKWDGSSWSALGSGTSHSVRALAVFDDGGGPALFAGGSFTSAGGTPANQIAKWDGSSWSALGSGVGAGGVLALAVYDDGGGPALFAGGHFTSAGGTPANHIAKWDGSSWSALGSGTSDSVFALAAIDVGGGEALYAGGAFDSAGGFGTANKIAKWDGSAWSALGIGMNLQGSVASLAGFDDGNGPALFAGGSFTKAGGIDANRIARWDGSSWRAMSTGVGGGPFPGVSALAVHDDGSGPALFVGGAFVQSPGRDGNLAKWGCKQEQKESVQRRRL